MYILKTQKLSLNALGFLFSYSQQIFCLFHDFWEAALLLNLFELIDASALLSANTQHKKTKVNPA